MSKFSLARAKVPQTGRQRRLVALLETDPLPFLLSGLSTFPVLKLILHEPIL